MDPMEFLATTDPLKRGLMQGVAVAAREIQRRHDRERANMTAYEILSMLNASMKKS